MYNSPTFSFAGHLARPLLLCLEGVALHAPVLRLGLHAAGPGVDPSAAAQLRAGDGLLVPRSDPALLRGHPVGHHTVLGQQRWEYIYV